MFLNLRENIEYYMLPAIYKVNTLILYLIV